MPLYALVMVIKRAIRTLWTVWRDPQTRGITYLASGILALGTVFYRFVEDMRWVDAFYFSFITLTTIGYGDISPQTDLGKIFTVFYVLIGLGVLASFITAVATHQQRLNAPLIDLVQDAAQNDEDSKPEQTQ